MCKSLTWAAGATEGLQTKNQILIGRNYLVQKNLFMFLDENILFFLRKFSERFQFFGENIQHIIGIGLLNKATALVQNTVQCCITHKISLL